MIKSNKRQNISAVESYVRNHKNAICITQEGFTTEESLEYIPEELVKVILQNKK